MLNAWQVCDLYSCNSVSSPALQACQTESYILFMI